MKTLLLSLVVVAFVYLHSGHTIKCWSCDNIICIKSQDCPNATACFKKSSGLLELNVDRGCAPDCTYPAADETIQYCAKDNCNM